MELRELLQNSKFNFYEFSDKYYQYNIKKNQVEDFIYKLDFVAEKEVLYIEPILKQDEDNLYTYTIGLYILLDLN